MTRFALGVVVLLLVGLTGPTLLAQEPPPPPATDTAEEPPLTPPPPAETVRVPPPPPPKPRPAPPANPRGDDAPVVRAEGGNLGMYFRFGGLATLTHSNNSRTAGSLVFTQVGMKFVFSEHFMLPIYFGSGVRVDNPDQGDSQTNWGIDVGAGFEYHFRIWRRISPFLGVSLGVDVEDATGDDNMTVGMGMGPSLGVEYYIGDRLSLTAMYLFVIQLRYTDNPNPAREITSFGLSTLAGGAVNITYYF